MVVPQADNVTLTNFRGLNIQESSFTVDDPFLTFAENVVVRGGDIEIREPFQLAVDTVYTAGGSPSRVLKDLFGSVICVGEASALVMKASLFDTRVGNTVLTDLGGPAIGSGATWVGGADFVTAVKVGDNYYFGGEQGLYKRTGAGVWSNIVLPDANVGVAQLNYYKNRLWVVSSGRIGGTPTESVGYRLYYSAAANPDSITNLIDVARNENTGRLIAAIPFSDRIMCFNQNSVWNLYISGDTASWSQRLFLRGQGAVNAQSVLEYKGSVYFLNGSGVFRTDGNVLEEISAPIRDWIAAGQFLSSENTYSINLYQDCLIVRSFGGLTSPSGNFIYNLEWDTWTTWASPSEDGINKYGCTWHDAQGREVLWFGSQNSNIIDYGTPDFGDVTGNYEDYDYTNGGNDPIAMEIRTKRFDQGKFFRDKVVTDVEVEIEGMNMISVNGESFVDGNVTAVESRTYTTTEYGSALQHLLQFPGPRYARRFYYRVRVTTIDFFRITGINIVGFLKRNEPVNPSG